MHDIDDYPDARPVQGLVVYRYDSPLFFANVEDFKRRALASLDSADTPTEWFLLNAEANVQVDITAIDALEELRQELDRRGIVFAMARVKQDLRDDLQPSGLRRAGGRGPRLHDAADCRAGVRPVVRRPARRGTPGSPAHLIVTRSS